MQSEADLKALALTADIMMAYLSNPKGGVGIEEIPAALQNIYAAFSLLDKPVPSAASEASMPPTPAVTLRKSLASPDHIISMIDGKPYKTLRRHLSSHDLTPEQYRERFGLKSDYPMVAPNYSVVRREMAKRIGLGRNAAHNAAALSSTESVPTQDEQAEGA